MRVKIISAKTHGVLDYFVVLVFLAAPSQLHLSQTPALISYSLAGIHLALTLLTNFPLGVLRVIPLKIHGMIELVVGPCLIALPFILGFTSEPLAESYYIASGAVILVVWALTKY